MQIMCIVFSYVRITKTSHLGNQYANVQVLLAYYVLLLLCTYFIYAKVTLFSRLKPTHLVKQQQQPQSFISHRLLTLRMNQLSPPIHRSHLQLQAMCIRSSTLTWDSSSMSRRLGRTCRSTSTPEEGPLLPSRLCHLKM